MALTSHVLAQGEGWRVVDSVCDHGPRDRPFEEQHAQISIAAVTRGTFHYRTRQGAATLVPGSLLLGNAGVCFQCGHPHSAGDRCLSFQCTPEFAERVIADVPGATQLGFTVPSLPPCEALLPLLTAAEAARDDRDAEALEELALCLPAAVAALTAKARPVHDTPSTRDVRQISAAVLRIEQEPNQPRTLARLAREAGMSRFHFLRSFARVTGMTPHRYVLHMRMHRAALRLRQTREPVAAIAYDAGFNDLSTFNRRFRRVMGANPSAFRAG